jgi:hypothetical protein
MDSQSGRQEMPDLDFEPTETCHYDFHYQLIQRGTQDDRKAFFAIFRLCNGYVYGVYGANALDAWFLRFFNGELSRGGKAPQISNKQIK